MVDPEDNDPEVIELEGDSAGETSSWSDAEEPAAETPFPKLYTEVEVAKIMLRFAVGDSVLCNIDSSKGKAEGVVIKRFYREDEWPQGYYAAVRRSKPPTPFARTATTNMHRFSARSIKCV